MNTYIAPTFNHLYLTSNELGQEPVLEKLRDQHRFPKNGECILGVSGLCTLNMASIRNITEIHIVDCAPAVQEFWTKLIPILTKNPVRKAALDAIQAEISSNRATYFANLKSGDAIDFCCEQSLRSLDEEVENGISFLSNLERIDEHRYQTIHQLAKDGKIYFHLADLCHLESATNLIQMFQQKKSTFDVIYISNISACYGDDFDPLVLKCFLKQMKTLNHSDCPPHIVEGIGINPSRQNIQKKIKKIKPSNNTKLALTANVSAIIPRGRSMNQEPDDHTSHNIGALQKSHGNFATKSSHDEMSAINSDIDLEGIANMTNWTLKAGICLISFLIFFILKENMNTKFTPSTR